MKRLRVAQLAIVGLSAAALSACSAFGLPGATGGGPGPGPYPLTASSAFATKTTLSSTTTARLQATSTTSPAVDSAANVSIAKNSSGGYDVTVDGKTVSFAATDQTGTPTTQGGTYFGSYANSANSTQNYMTLFGKGSYSGLLAASTLTNGTGENDVFAAIGSPTDPSVLASKANATYSGRMIMTAAPDAPVNATTTINAGIQGDVTLNADFSAGNVSGQVNNLTTEGCAGGDCGAESGSWGGVPQSGSMTMGTAPISGNSFTGSLSGSGSFASTAGTYTGNFYGPNGQEATGVVSGTATGLAGGSEKDTFVGGFTTTQN